MALRLMLQGTSSIVRSSVQATNLGLWPLLNQNPLHPPCCLSRHASSISSSICNGVKSPNGNAAVLGSGTSIYQGAQKDEWIVRLAKFAVSQQNENQLWKNLMDLLVWKRVNDALSAVGTKRGDLQLHEAVMLYMNQVKKICPII